MLSKLGIGFVLPKHALYLTCQKIKTISHSLANSHKKMLILLLKPNHTKSERSPKGEDLATYQLSPYLELCQKLIALSEDRFDLFQSH